MLSPAAARMGKVLELGRKKGRRSYLSASVGGCFGRNQKKCYPKLSLLSSTNGTTATRTATLLLPETTRAAFSSSSSSTSDYASSRWKSTMASYNEDESDDGDDDIGDVVKNNGGGGASSNEESWMINLGRNDNNEWLTGPRDDEWFTGKHPKISPGASSTGNGIIRSLPLPTLNKVTRESAMEYFDNSWTLYETLFAGLKGEEYFYRPPPHGLRHPQIFYYGHTACLYINKMRISGVLNKPCNAYFESIFEVGVDEMLWDDMEKNEMFWPTVREVHEYRQQVYEVVKDAILNSPFLDDSNGPVTVTQDHPMWGK
ncbi:MAG: hypothetical protein ACI8RD_002761 [Bacillariaceae sp.]|jgi:hypothetical protein